MAFSGYLAMTAAEMLNCSVMPKKMAYMACHFSPYGLGLSNLPERLPPGSILILNDRTPIHRHDPKQIVKELAHAADTWQCTGVLLDFQRPGYEEASAVVKAAADLLPCPLCVTPEYADGVNCPILLPPIPADTALDTYLAPYQGRAIWLEVAFSPQVITVTPEGARCQPLSQWKPPADSHRDETLCCHYTIETTQSEARFTLFRTPEDLSLLMEKAASMEVSCFMGLYQELFDIL